MSTYRLIVDPSVSSMRVVLFVLAFFANQGSMWRLSNMQAHIGASTGRAQVYAQISTRPVLDPEFVGRVTPNPELFDFVDPNMDRTREVEARYTDWTLEVDGTPLKRDAIERAVAKRQFATYRTAIWPSFGDEDRGLNKNAGFPESVRELKKMLATPGNNIYNHWGPRLQRTHSEYEEIIGKGVAGVVYKRTFSVNGQEKVYAVKTIPFSSDEEQQRRQVYMAVKEIRTMVKAADDHLVQLYDVYFMDVWNGNAPSPMLHLVMDCGIETYGELIESHSGADWDQWQYETALSDMLQMLRGIRTMHGAGIAHRDVKPGNLVYFHSDRDLMLKWIDFGHADGPGVIGSFKSKELRGTPEFVSPEVAENFLYYEVLPNTVDGRYMDLWALGIMLYRLLVGDYPFYRGATGDKIKDIEVLCGKVKEYKDNYPASAFTFESSPMALKAKRVINGLLHPAPHMRMSLYVAIDEITQLLQDALRTRAAVRKVH